jgi:hypothetical protein
MIIKKFNEVNLNLQELEKNLKGKKKGQHLIDRLRKNNDFTISRLGEEGYPKDVKFDNADEVADKIVKSEDEFDSTKAKTVFRPSTLYNPVFQGDDDKLYRLNDIKKDEFFGSSGGSSLGFEKTRKVESIQCLFFGLKQMLLNKTEITTQDIPKIFSEEGGFNQSIMNYVRIPNVITHEVVSEFLETDQDGWVDTFLNTANSIYESDLQLIDKPDRTVLNKQKKYVFHQIGVNTPLISMLSDAYHSCEKSKGIPISKWTPSDVWAVELLKENKVISQLGLTSTITELNSLIDILFKRSQLIGISLKKVGGKENIKLVINKLTLPPQFFFDRIVINANPYGSKGITIEANYRSTVVPSGKDRIFFRSYSGDQTVSDISGEVDGHSSRFGKVGLNWVNKILSKYELDLVPDKIEILSNPEIYTKSFLKSEIERICESIPNKLRVRSKSIEETQSNLISKYQSLKLSEILMNNFDQGTSPRLLVTTNRTVVDEVVQGLFYYGMAISNLQFECPMYVRIVTI